MKSGTLTPPLAALPGAIFLVFIIILAGVPASPGAQTSQELVQLWSAEWPRTDFSKSSINLWEIVSGGPPKDGIPPIDHPRFVSISQAEKWVQAKEPVLVFEHRGDVRAYPLQVLIWHEIVNDVVGGKPVVVTFCPLCNSALVFDREAGGRLLDFGTTGKLRKSDLVMWDRQTQSWWQQLTGEAIVGEMTGTRLTYLPAPLVSFRTFREAFPKGKVLSKKTGVYRDYGANPYLNYDSPRNTQPFLFRGAVDSRLHAVERVVVLEMKGEAKAYPYGELRKAKVVNDTVGGVAVVVFFGEGVTSALDGPNIATSRDVGTGAIFRRTLAGRTLTFDLKNGALVDRETNTRWNLLGHALEGKLKGKRLPPVAFGNHFAFAWLAFRPGSKIYAAP